MIHEMAAPNGLLYEADVAFTNDEIIVFDHVAQVDVDKHYSIIYHDNETTFLNMANVLQISVKGPDDVAGVDVPRVLRHLSEEGDQA